MRIITVSREFGSGGRELGKRIADNLGCDYYDREILTMIAEKHGLTEEYVEDMLNRDFVSSIPLTFRTSFAAMDAMADFRTELLVEQTSIIKNIASLGRDCVIVGRNADIILNDYKTFNVFVCADMEARIARCKEYSDKHERLSEKELEKNIKRIDKERAKSRELIADSQWGDSRAYHLTVNTSGWEIKKLAPIVADYAQKWFER